MKPSLTNKLVGLRVVFMKVALLLLALLSGQAVAEVYVGGGLQVRDLRMLNGHGKHSFVASAPAMDIYSGFKFSEFFALEAGFHAAKSKSRTAAYNPHGWWDGETTTSDDEMSPVAPAPAPIPDASVRPVGGPAVMRNIEQEAEKILSSNSIRVSGMHFGVAGFLPIPNTDFNLVGSLGGSYLNTLFKANSVKTLKHRVDTVVPRAMGGVEYNLGEGLKVRCSAVWERTSRVKVRYVKMKDSVHYGAGIQYMF